MKPRKIILGSHTIMWKKGYMPYCDCWLSRMFPFIYCSHIYELSFLVERGIIERK